MRGWDLFFLHGNVNIIQWVTDTKNESFARIFSHLVACHHIYSHALQSIMQARAHQRHQMTETRDITVIGDTISTGDTSGTRDLVLELDY